jgi:DGQHR domain-containing protein
VGTTKRAKTRTRKTTKKGAPSATQHVEFPCISFQQGEMPLYLFVASAKALWELVDVDRKIENKEQGYQRTLSAARVAKLAGFIDAGNVIPNSVLISFDEGTSEGDGTLLRVPRRSDAGWVIDGQHRLAGAHEAQHDIQLAVIAFVNLPQQEQIKQFVTINREQKGVPSSLYLELLKHLPGSKTETQIAETRSVDLANLMKVDEESPFFTRIVTTTSPAEGQLSTTNFVRKVAPLVRKNGRLNIYPDDTRAAIINNYYLGLANVFPREYKKKGSIFFKTLGFGALLSTLPLFLDLTLGERRTFKVADVAAVFKRIDFFDFEGWHQMGTGSAAENTAADDLRQALTDAFSDAGKQTAGIVTH